MTCAINLSEPCPNAGAYVVVGLKNRQSSCDFAFVCKQHSLWEYGWSDLLSCHNLDLDHCFDLVWDSSALKLFDARYFYYYYYTPCFIAVERSFLNDVR